MNVQFMDFIEDVEQHYLQCGTNCLNILKSILKVQNLLSANSPVNERSKWALPRNKFESFETLFTCLEVCNEDNITRSYESEVRTVATTLKNMPFFQLFVNILKTVGYRPNVLQLYRKLRLTTFLTKNRFIGPLVLLTFLYL